MALTEFENELQEIQVAAEEALEKQQAVAAWLKQNWWIPAAVAAFLFPKHLLTVGAVGAGAYLLTRRQ